MGYPRWSILYWSVVGMLTILFFPYGLIILALALIATGIDMRHRALNQRARVDGTATLATGVVALGMMVAVFLSLVFRGSSDVRSDDADGSAAPTPTISRAPAG